MNITTNTASWIKPVARAGLIAKGIVYTLLGTLAFMAAFEIGGQSDNKATKQGVLELVRDEGGKTVLAMLAVGLFCYSLWRIVQTFSSREHSSNQTKATLKKLRYFFSGLAYGSVAVVAAGMAFSNDSGSKGSSNSRLADVLDKSWGQWAVGLLALVLAGIGIYQIYYGLTEKYRKHVNNLNLHSNASRLLLRSGKIGYAARGVVWIIISWLLMKAAIHANSNEAGDTGKAFRFLENASYGSLLLGVLGLGLMCYGVFNFIRSRYETNF